MARTAWRRALLSVRDRRAEEHALFVRFALSAALALVVLAACSSSEDREDASQAAAYVLKEATVPVAGVQGVTATGGFLWAWSGHEIWRYTADGWAAYSSAPLGTADLAYDGDTVWAATGFELVYLDGVDWVVLSAAPDEPVKVEADPGTGVVFVSAGGELHRWDGEEMINLGGGPEDYYVTDIAATGDGSIWAAGNFWGIVGGLARYDDLTSSWELVRPLGGREDLPHGLATAPNGSLWVMLVDLFEDSEEREAAGEPIAESTLARRDVATGEWTFYRGLSAGFTWPMAAENDAVWLAPFDPAEEVDSPVEGVMRFDGDTWTHHETGSPVADIAVAPDGTIWVATQNGELRQLKRSSPE